MILRLCEKNLRCGNKENSAQLMNYMEGFKKDLKLTEYVIAGPMLAIFIMAFSVRYRMSRVKIREFLAFRLKSVNVAFQ